ncbi:MAG: hypothetical protein IKY34_07470 [Ruminiclostridium sp.]|nr:hypothetical protein [Ruminiclostridium sp.]
MKSNGTKMGALQLAQIATILGAVTWAAGLFSNYAIIPFRGLYLFFAVMSVVQLVMSLKIAGISRETEGDPLKTSVTACIICFVLQLIFFGALVVLGPEALPWAQRVFLTAVALYILPALVYYAAKVNKM